ncbi:MAG: hypothetical protein ACE3JQ_07565 [Paenisporosarcina sp.]
METSIPSKSFIQIESIGKFLQDVWLSAFIVVFFSSQTALSTPFVWVGILISILITVTILFHKTGYQIAISVVVSVFFGLTIFAFNGPFWLFALIVFFAIWRIQERFSSIQEDATHDGFFFTLIVLFFAMSASLATVLQNNEALNFSYVIAISGMLVFILERLTVHWMLTKDINQLAFTKVGLMYLAITGVPLIVFYLISNFAKWTRVQIVNLFGDLFMIILYPIGLLFNWLKDVFQLRARIPEEQESDKFAEPIFLDITKQSSELNVMNDIPWTIIGIVMIVVLILFFIWRFSKKKRELVEGRKEIASFHRETIQHAQLNETTDITWAYSMETNIVREAYREFEKEATAFEYTRQKEETIREWFKRQNWDVEERFYTIYDVVRYSHGSMNAQDGEWFIHQLALLSIKYFQKEV